MNSLMSYLQFGVLCTFDINDEFSILCLFVRDVGVEIDVNHLCHLDRKPVIA